MDAFTKAGVSGRSRRRLQFVRRIVREFGDPPTRTAYLMVGPTLLLITAVAILPIAYSVWLSFRDATPESVGAGFVGLSNYGQMFGSARFQDAVINTSVFTVLSVMLELVLGMLIALALNRYFLGRGTVRAVALLPWAFPAVIAAAIWRLMYVDQVGIVSYVSESIGVFTGSILSDDISLMAAMIAVDVWKSAPLIAVLLLAGLQVIPGEVYEAARMDGASPLRQFWSITVPLVRPAMVIALLFRVLDAWRVYDLPYVLSGRQLSTLSTYVYEGVRIRELDFAVGNAAAVFVFASSLLIALMIIRFVGTRAQ